MSSVIIILKIEVSSRQPLGTQFSNPENGPKSEENDVPRYHCIAKLAGLIFRKIGPCPMNLFCFCHCVL